MINLNVSVPYSVATIVVEALQTKVRILERRASHYANTGDLGAATAVDSAIEDLTVAVDSVLKQQASAHRGAATAAHRWDAYGSRS